MTKLGIIREGKVPPDKRVPLTPKHCVTIKEQYPDLEIVVQSSKVRKILVRKFRCQEPRRHRLSVDGRVSSTRATTSRCDLDAVRLDLALKRANTDTE